MIDACVRYCTFLEELTPETLSRLDEYVACDVHFVDPFNDVRGRAAMAHIYRDMFKIVGPVTFEISHKSCDGRTCMLAWTFSATLRGRPWKFDGTSVIQFGVEDMVIKHKDYWDAAGDFYEKLPVIGWLLAVVRQRFQAD